MPYEKLNYFSSACFTAQQILGEITIGSLKRFIQPALLILVSIKFIMEIFIRPISKEDALAVTTLTHQLGYPLAFEQILENINAVRENKDHDAFVAMHDNRLIGWVGVAQALQIESAPFCEIRGLVVDDQYRNRGVGKLLVEQAKKWGREKTNDKLRLRCNVKRTEAHLFYQHLGFKEAKQQKVFEIEI